MDIPSYLLGKKAGGGGGSDLQTKSVTVTQNGSSQITPDTGYDGLTKVNLTTNVQPTNQTKSLTITENGTTSISPDLGYDGLSEVEITTNVSGGSSDLDWSVLGYTERPKIINEGYNYAVQVKNNWNPSLETSAGKFQDDYKLVFMPLVDSSNVNNMTWMFYNCYSLISVPLLNTSNVTNFISAFNNCCSLKEIPLIDTSSVTKADNMFNNCYCLEKIPVLNTSNVTSCRNTFFGCKSLNNESLDNILQMCINATSYTGTKTLAYIGFNSSNYPASKIMSLTHYQNFIDAGWTIGY